MIGCVAFAQQILYVAPQGDDAADGSATAPLRTIARALALADDNGTVIRVASGSYAESQTLDLRSNLTIEGGLDATTWQPDGLATTITVDALQSVLDYNQKIAFRSMGVNHWTLIRLRMAVASATAADRAYSGKGASTYVLLINGDADGNQLIDCELLCGNGGDGISGTTGAAGASGNNGSSGGDGGLSEWTNDGDDEGIGGSAVGSGVRTGGRGGNGGEGSVTHSQGGYSGVTGTTGGNGSGGTGGYGGSGGSAGHTGSVGGTGSNGANGVTPTTPVTYTWGYYFIPAAQGLSGTDGAGGG
ncbi:MAG: DUF1565 domain-containing protein, partial [Bacteroidales bacterium]|nr:DUF1565 domain-containing protein [Bacteroidales bacterium]